MLFSLFCFSLFFLFFSQVYKIFLNKLNWNLGSAWIGERKWVAISFPLRKILKPFHSKSFRWNLYAHTHTHTHTWIVLLISHPTSLFISPLCLTWKLHIHTLTHRIFGPTLSSMWRPLCIDTWHNGDHTVHFLQCFYTFNKTTNSIHTLQCTLWSHKSD